LLQVYHSKSGHLGVAESGFWGYFTAVTPSGGVGTILVLAVLAGVIISFRKPRVEHWLLFSFPCFFYLLLGNSALKVDRYLIPVIPFWCIYAGMFVARSAQALARWHLSARLVAPALAVLFTAPSIYYAGKWCGIALQRDTRVQAADWMEANMPKETIIAIRAGSWMLPPVPDDHFNITQMDLITEESTKKRLSLKLDLMGNPLVAWILHEAFDYETSPAARDSLRAVLQHMPDIATWRAPPLSHYRELDVHFVITSSLLRERFFESTTIAKFPEMAKSWQAFYLELEQQGRLVKEFAPPESWQPRWGMGFLESPIIRIYDIRGSERQANGSMGD